ncbi:Pyridoxal phosphate-dependent transferase [Rhodotorula toruloides]|nr:Pyridoxal phosphate-dependent transferase [Rhodotorula toruloides]
MDPLTPSPAGIEAERLSYDRPTHRTQLARVHEHLSQRIDDLASLPAHATKDAIERGLGKSERELPAQGRGLEATTTHLLEDIVPGLMPGQAGPRCFGLVIGGVTPAAQIADQLVGAYDPCVQVHWPESTLSVAIEARTLSYLLQLLSLPSSAFTQNTLTTGATASNVLGLALGRDFSIASIKSAQGHPGWSVSEDGMGGVEVDVFVVDAHASVRKAAALTGLGRKSVVECGREGESGLFDLGVLEERLRRNWEVGRGSIVSVSFGEVNTGYISPQTPSLRTLCNTYHTWLHLDAAFSAFATLSPLFAHYTPHLALADSITSDAHKWLNVGYDCGLFFSRRRRVTAGEGGGEVGLWEVTGPGKAGGPAYLAPTAASKKESEGEVDYPLIEESKGLPSPLFMGIENSRRFRALPLYASLISLGSSGYTSLIQRNILFAHRLSSFLSSHPGYKLLTPPSAPLTLESVEEDPWAYRTSNILLFALSLDPQHTPTRFLSHPDPNALLLTDLNKNGRTFWTGTVWRGERAVRCAVSNWMTGWEWEEGEGEGRELEEVKEVLEGVVRM